MKRTNGHEATLKELSRAEERMSRAEVSRCQRLLSLQSARDAAREILEDHGNCDCCLCADLPGVLWAVEIGADALANELPTSARIAIDPAFAEEVAHLAGR